MNDILHDSEMDALLDNCHQVSGGIFNQIVTSDQDPPSTVKIYTEDPDAEPDLEAPKDVMIEQAVYRKNL